MKICFTALMLSLLLPCRSAIAQMSTLPGDQRSMSLFIAADDTYGIHQAVKIDGIVVGGIVKHVVPNANQTSEDTLYQPFFTVSPRRTELLFDSISAMAWLLDNMPDEPWMPVWEYDKWKTLTDRTLAWQIRYPESDLWSIKPTITEFFGPKTKEMMPVFPRESEVNAYVVSGFLHQTIRPFAYLGSEIIHQGKRVKVPKILKDFPLLLEYDTQPQLIKQTSDGVTYYRLEVMAPDRYTKYIILATRTGDRLRYLLMVIAGEQEAQNLQLVAEQMTAQFLKMKF